MTRARLDEAAAALYDVCSAITGRPADAAADTELPSGRALSPGAAAACTRDGLRTAAFLRGLHDAIRAAQKTFPGQTIEVVYAGTGPFAPLALPLMTVFTPAEVRFTLLDIHEQSVHYVRTLVRHFGFHRFIRTILTTDATTYRHTAPVHIVAAEVMQRALGIEPHVEIVRNLSRQLQPGGILVPQRVSVDLALQPRHGDPAGRTLLGSVTEIHLAAMTAWPDGLRRFRGRVVTVPTPIDGHQPLYITTIDVYGRHRLREYDSGLTHPEIAWDLLPLRENERIAFSFEFGPRPGIRWQRLAGNA